jgi:Fe-S cluster assembly protein SufD
MEGLITSDKVKVEESEEGFVISIPENSRENVSINLKERKMINIVVGINSEVKILGVCNGELDLFVGENSQVDYISIPNEDDDLVRRAEVEKNGRINWVDCCLSKSKSFVVTKLKGDGSESESLSVVFGNSEEDFEMGNEVIHYGDSSKSNMLTRIVLDNNAKADFKGLVRVSKDAKNCQGYQKKETILLSEDAKVDAVPNLEIENNDVSCSHGATISQIDDDKLFYLMSRGLNEREAKKSIVEGFFDPILVKIDNEEVKENIKNTIAERLAGLK